MVITNPKLLILKTSKSSYAFYRFIFYRFRKSSTGSFVTDANHPHVFLHYLSVFVCVNLILLPFKQKGNLQCVYQKSITPM